MLTEIYESIDNNILYINNEILILKVGFQTKFEMFLFHKDVNKTLNSINYWSLIWISTISKSNIVFCFDYHLPLFKSVEIERSSHALFYFNQVSPGIFVF